MEASSAKSTTAMSWLRSSPEGKKQQVDSALEFALESVLAQRPLKPLRFVAERLWEWDAAVNGSWPLRQECEAVFSRADADSSGFLDLSEMTAMRQSAEFAELMLTNLDADMSGKVSLSEWLVHMKANADKNAEATKSMLALYDQYLTGAKQGGGPSAKRRDMAM